MACTSQAGSLSYATLCCCRSCRIQLSFPMPSSSCSLSMHLSNLVPKVSTCFSQRVLQSFAYGGVTLLSGLGLLFDLQRFEFPLERNNNLDTWAHVPRADLDTSMELPWGCGMTTDGQYLFPASGASGSIWKVWTCGRLARYVSAKL